MSEILPVENLKIMASGTALLLEPVSREAIELTGAEKPNVLLIGTPKPKPEDFAEFVVKGTNHFEGLGVSVTNLHEYEQAPSEDEATHKIASADMLWVTGGDTLKMLDFWREHDIDTKIGTAALNGTVLAGGSAGTLAWFEQGHSDWESYRREDWEYHFVRGMGYIAATGCPHYDSETQGKSRKEYFDDMYKVDQTLPGVGVCITNRAALALNDGKYKIITAPDPEWLSEIHILRKTEDGLSDDLLPISNDYLPFDIKS